MFLCSVQPCPSLPSIPNGMTELDVPGDYGDGTSQGAIFNVMCDPGYEVTGSARLLCSGGAWSHALPACIRE